MGCFLLVLWCMFQWQPISSSIHYLQVGPLQDKNDLRWMECLDKVILFLKLEKGNNKQQFEIRATVLIKYSFSACIIKYCPNSKSTTSFWHSLIDEVRWVILMYKWKYLKSRESLITNFQPISMQCFAQFWIKNV